MTRVQGPRGAPDVLPPDSSLLTQVESLARETFERHGYERVETPLFEHTDVFLRAVGDASDIVVQKQMYTFTDPGDRSLSLRPEGTASVARAFVQHRPDGTQPLPLRWWYIGPMFRYERPQRGRDRQFLQAGVECIGSAEPVVDAEVIAMAAAFFAALGLEPDLLLNTMGCAADRERYFPELRKALAPHLGELCEDCVTRLGSNPLRAFDCKVPACRKLLAAHAPPIAEFVCADCRTHYETVQRLLEALGVTWTPAPELVRGLDYYTRTVFEFELPSLGARATLCGGGRYDGLIGQLGGPDTPALGFAIGITPTLLACREAVSAEARGPDVYLVWLEGLDELALSTARDLRAAGLRVVMSDAARSLKAQLRTADRTAARRAVILGPQEVERGAAGVRDMTTGEQDDVPLAELAARLAGGERS